MSGRPPLMGNCAPRGDGHSVLLLPGFHLGDLSDMTLASAVLASGCRPERWGLGLNEGPTTRVLAGLSSRLMELHERDDRTISLVGVSLGGVFARMLARQYPQVVRRVVTVGSPIHFDGQGKSRIIDRLWRRRVGTFDQAALDEIHHEEESKVPLEMPTTSIYSRLDNVVAWNKSLDAVGNRSENIGVRGATHLGLLLHPGVHLALTDRIRQPEGDWRPFVAPLAGRLFFEEPVFYDAERAGGSGERASAAAAT